MQLFIKIRPYVLTCFFILIGLRVVAQRDCLTYEENTKERSACEVGLEAIKYKQGSRQSQLLFDKAIQLNPDYAWAYYEKSVPYLKRGMLGEGMKILNKAVELDPLSYLTYRAYWYFQHKSYLQAKQDLEKFYALEDAYPKNTPGGALDMKIVLGINYAHLGDLERAISIVKGVIDAYDSEDYLGPYDNHTLGVLYLQAKDYENALETLMKSIERNEQFADTYYYLAIVSEQLGDKNKAIEFINEAILRYTGEKPGYTDYPFCFPVSIEIAKAKKVELANL
ncbi:tetratricopeptide repeat protein [Roseivirga misakiensis]|uniref:Uncharacterized protein n=1 Tax=Roseivirga misakiensis TaxID=1563681 RepID=A0A1E5SL89_9BACT|nr:tetratricopeptide repeat protein [Roseivirga misakiensis]OEJ99892.1 hypothetical protein BFP71_10110 [Roseivirga misakiensis]